MLTGQCIAACPIPIGRPCGCKRWDLRGRPVHEAYATFTALGVGGVSEKARPDQGKPSKRYGS